MTVGPREKDVALLDYPYFLDFQPKQRALYEQTSDTGEQVSRSLEGLNVHKGAATTDSVEVLDADAGFSPAVQPQLAGDAHGVRLTHAARDVRDTLSHTTQIAQTYNLFQAYHLGTNRALFYVAPRPHVLKEPSGFIRGPRVLDGIQEVFLVVSQAESQGDPCLAVRLDTSHLTKRDILDFDRSRAPIPLQIERDLPPPEEGASENVPLEETNPHYDCFALRATVQDSRTASAGFKVERTVDVVNEAQNGVTRIEVSPDRRTVTLHGDVESRACFLNTFGHLAKAADFLIFGPLLALILNHFPETRDAESGHIKRGILIHLVSEQRTKKVGEEPILLVTSRSVCCCPEKPKRRHLGPKIIGIESLTQPLSLIPRDVFTPIPPGVPPPTGGATRPPGIEPPVNPATRPAGVTAPRDPLPDLMTSRQANMVSEIIADATRRITTSIPDPEKQRGLDRGFLLAGLISEAAATPAKQRQMRQPIGDAKVLSRDAITKLGRALGVSPKALTRYHAATAPETVLAEASGVRGTELTRLRLRLLGMPVRGGRDSGRDEK